MEHLNNYLKEGFRRLRSNLNENTADIVGKTMNNVRKLVNNTEESLKSVTSRSSHTKPSTNDDVKKLAEEMFKANLLTETKSRCYETFKYFEENLLHGLDYDTMHDWVKGHENTHRRTWMRESEVVN